MTPELTNCSLCGQELTEEQILASRTLEIGSPRKVLSICPRCQQAMGDDLEDDFLEFLLSS